MDFGGLLVVPGCVIALHPSCIARPTCIVINPSLR
jgi:hypothetical protein